MGELLLISDSVARAQSLALDLDAFRRCVIHDLYDDKPLGILPEILVGDVEVLDSAAILRLRRILKVTNAAGAPFLCLMHDNGPRAHVQAVALGVTSMLSVEAAPGDLLNALASLCGHAEPLPLTVRRRAAGARQFFEAILADQSAITPAFVEMGADLVSMAVRDASIRDWVHAVRCFDDLTHQHCLLVAGLAAAFSVTLGFNASDQHRLTKAALLHDVGKAQIPRHILNKPGPLDLAEQAVMRTHAAQGHALLAGRGFEEIMLRIVRSHHEMLDGSGYPDKLKGTEIPDMVRLVTICDIYGALIEHRPYRAPMPFAQAYGILQGMTGRLDGDLVRAFRAVAETFGPLVGGASPTRAVASGSNAGTGVPLPRQVRTAGPGQPDQRQQTL